MYVCIRMMAGSHIGLTAPYAKLFLVSANQYAKARKRGWAVGPKNALSYFKVYDFDCQTSPQFSCFSIPFIFMHQTFSLLVRLIGDKIFMSDKLWQLNK